MTNVFCQIQIKFKNPSDEAYLWFQLKQFEKTWRNSLIFCQQTESLNPNRRQPIQINVKNQFDKAYDLQLKQFEKNSWKLTDLLQINEILDRQLKSKPIINVNT